MSLDFRFQIADGRLRIADGGWQISDGRLQIADFGWQRDIATLGSTQVASMPFGTILGLLQQAFGLPPASAGGLEAILRFLPARFSGASRPALAMLIAVEKPGRA